MINHQNQENQPQDNEAGQATTDFQLEFKSWKKKRGKNIKKIEKLI